MKRLFLTSAILLWFASAFFAQDVNIDIDETMLKVVDDSLVVDSLASDTLALDSIAEPVALPWPLNVQARLDAIVHSRQFESTQIALQVYDLTADSVIYQYNERQQMRPASTMKMICAVAALDKLGGSYQFKTKLYYTGKVDSCVLRGNVYCKGGMDPAFNADDLNAFVESLKRMGIDTIRGNVYADLWMKDNDRWGEGWCWDDDNPTLSPLLVGKKDRFMSRFVKGLHDAHIVLVGDTLKGITPPGAFEICSRFHTMDQILTRMMKNSDNLYAESMFYQLAASTGNRPATAKLGRELINRLIQKLGFNPGNYYIADGSGLSLYNYVSPELEVAFLRYAYGHENIYNHLLPSMPIGGVDGTLENRMRQGFARSNVKAKTGTVTGVSALAGYLTASNGHRLCFSIINQGQRKANTVRPYQDRICEALCKP